MFLQPRLSYVSLCLPSPRSESMSEVIQQSNSWLPLLKLRCHPDSKIFLCSLFAPVCLGEEHSASTIYPCRWVGRNVNWMPCQATFPLNPIHALVFSYKIEKSTANPRITHSLLSLSDPYVRWWSWAARGQWVGTDTRGPRCSTAPTSQRTTTCASGRNILVHFLLNLI